MTTCETPYINIDIDIDMMYTTSSTLKYGTMDNTIEYILDGGKFLDMKECDITVDKLVEIFKKIDKPEIIEYVDMSDNYIDDHIDVGKIIKELFTKKFAKVEHIDLSSNKLGHNFTMVLVKILSKYNNRLFLDLSNNNFTPYDKNRILKATTNVIIVFESV
jgi:Ran GTPase-activating protein (RanGAP) involved in mRNA processing and transport